MLLVRGDVQSLRPSHTTETKRKRHRIVVGLHRNLNVQLVEAGVAGRHSGVRHGGCDASEKEMHWILECIGLPFQPENRKIGDRKSGTVPNCTIF